MQEKVISNGISAFIVAYHEEKLIEQCLRSLKGIVDEIIVIHDGPCKDNTLNIARKYTNRVYEMDVNKGIGESHYIFAINQASHPWLLRIDADEYLDDELNKHLKELTKDSEVAAYGFIWPIWDGTKYISKGWPYKNFLFQKSKIGMIDIFHHPILVYGTSKNVPYIVHHKPLYNNYTNSTFKSKTIKWCKLQAIDHSKDLQGKETYNVNIIQIQEERNKKDLIYRIPYLTGFLSFLTILLEGVFKPYLLIQKGFWATALISSRYSYNVAREVRKLRNS